MRTVTIRACALALCLGTVANGGLRPALAAPLGEAQAAERAGQAELARCCRYRSNPPVYPYWYRPPTRPGGYSFYFGFVPYNRGDYESQAIQRLYPESNWPPSMRAPYPP